MNFGKILFDFWKKETQILPISALQFYIAITCGDKSKKAEMLIALPSNDARPSRDKDVNLRVSEKKYERSSGRY